MNTRVRILAITVLLASMSAVSWADGIDVGGTLGGNMTYAPVLGGELSVSGAPMNFLYDVSRPDTQFWLSPTIGGINTTGALSFTTGPSTQVNGGVFTFGASTSSTPDLTISGTVYKFDAGNHATQVASGTLFSAKFLGGSAFFNGGIGVISGLFRVTTLNPDLLTAVFGSIPHETSFLGSLGEVLSGVHETSNGEFTGTVASTNFVTQIPEPQNLVLLGSGFLIGAGLLRRLLGKQQDT